jgi:hypothetical protein
MTLGFGSRYSIQLSYGRPGAEEGRSYPPNPAKTTAAGSFAAGVVQRFPAGADAGPDPGDRGP